MRRTHALPIFVTFAALATVPPAISTPGDAGRDAFAALMGEVAEAWNRGDARRAADCFTENAIYSEPPAKQLFVGREALFEFFGGEAGRDQAMHMVWHHLAYDPDDRLGFGEFSFWIGDGDPSHGVVVARIEEGKIANWREYYYESDLHWEAFTAANPF